MRRYQLAFVLGLGLAAAPLAGCSDDAPPADPDAGEEPCTVPTAMRLHPLVMGATWTYAISEPMVPARMKVSTIEAYEDVGGDKAGVMAWRQRSEKLDGVTISWNEDRCTSVVRHRERNYDLGGVEISNQYYQPSKQRVDETRTTAGAMWTTSYTEIEVNPGTGERTIMAKDENWSLVETNVMVTVPKGTFTTMHYRKLTSGAAMKDYWFAPGIGKIKETGEQTEELVEFMIPAGP